MRNTIIPFGSPKVAENGPQRQSARNTVHVVDDKAEQMHFLRFAFEQAGYRTVFHLSLEAFANSISNENTKAVLVDVHLGENDATDVLDFLKRSKCKAEIYLTLHDTFRYCLPVWFFLLFHYSKGKRQSFRHQVACWCHYIG